MGRLAVPRGGLAYVDANSVIYRVERIEPYLTASAELWDALEEGTCRVVTSELTWLEVLVKPFREANETIASLFDQLLFASNLECQPIELAILEDAAMIRAVSRLKTPDAIHAATALRVGATLFVTNDRGFLRVPGLNVVILDDVAGAGQTDDGSGESTPNSLGDA